ncbi:MAG: manganese efflux pump [Akkermansia sp.]|nr:manganese efflux pump [Akkermansia sp.]
MLELVLIALALAVDATVYSFSYGLVLRTRRLASSLWLALCVGGFQAGMPLLGYWGGDALRHVVDTWAPWIVFVVFLLLGLSVIRECWCGDDDEGEGNSGSPLGAAALLLVGVATSIDALAVGVCMALGDMCGSHSSLAMLLVDVGIIGLVTFVCSMAAFHAARVLQHLPVKWLETAAGLLLIALGVSQLFR